MSPLLLLIRVHPRQSAVVLFPSILTSCRPTTTATEADSLLDLALDQMAAGNPSAAIPHLHQALTLNPNHPAATHALLRALEDTNQLPEALALARNLIAQSTPTTPSPTPASPSSCKNPATSPPPKPPPPAPASSTGSVN